MKKLVFLFLMISSLVNAQDADDLFSSANNLYKEGKYKEAIENYEQIVSKGLISSELYYNLGNSYYKLNKVGPSIYNYEKALQLAPLNEDVKNNLIFAQRLSLDKVKELPKTFFQKFNKNYLQTLSYNQWAYLVILLSFLGSLLFLLFYFAYTPYKKRFYFTTSILSFLLLIITSFITYHQYSKFKNKKEAIVYAEKTEVRNAPTLNSDEVFTLHEGTKVFVLDAVDNWKKIKLADGKLGWIISEEIKEL